METELFGNAFFHQRHDFLRRLFRILSFDKIEVCFRLRAADQFGHQAVINAVGVDNDPTLAPLSKDLGQPDRRDEARGNDVCQYLSRSYRGKLIHVAYQD